MDIKRIKQVNGPDLSYIDVDIIEKDNLKFKDLARTGELLPFEDYRLDPKERAKDLAKRLSEEDLIGLMLHSEHQCVPFDRPGMFHDTYNGKDYDDNVNKPEDLSDKQIDLIENQRVRHILQFSIRNVETSVKWSNNLQAFAEKQKFGIPVVISTDPRHGASSSSAEFKTSGEGVSKWPEGIGLAATFNPELVKEFAKVAAKEYRALGISMALGPQIDLATDPRWSRWEDTLGGDLESAKKYIKAYVSGMQGSDDGTWGKNSVITTVKHFPSGASGEGGRDAHYTFGKYNVYPGNRFEENLKVFSEAGFDLQDEIKNSGAVMPYYSISYGHGNNTGNSYNPYIIKDILRGRLGYDGVICTDWDITRDQDDQIDTFNSKSHGVEESNYAERHLILLENTIDQVGGDYGIAGIVEGVKLYKEKYGEEKTRETLEASAVRSLTNIFRLGLFEDPYLDVEESIRIVGNAEFRKRGLEAQIKSVVLLKDKDVLPLKKGIKVYVPERNIKPRKNFIRAYDKEKTFVPIIKEESENYFELVSKPEDAEAFIVWMESPLTDGGYRKEDVEEGGNGYVPIQLQYRPYTATHAREKAIANGDPRETCNRSYRNKKAECKNEKDLDNILELKEKYPDKKIIAIMEVHNPVVPAEFEPYVDAFIVEFGVEKRAVFDILFGDAKPTGKLPYPLPKNMETIEAHFEDVFDDYEHYVDECGNEYKFGFGLTK